jgi:hypothetical protein
LEKTIVSDVKKLNDLRAILLKSGSVGKNFRQSSLSRLPICSTYIHRVEEEEEREGKRERGNEIKKEGKKE